MDERHSRRTFLANTGRAAGAGWLGLHAGAIFAAAGSAAAAIESGAPWKVLATGEATRLAAVADQVYPPIDGLPGASEIGAVHFMDAAFEGFMAGPFPMVQAGLADLDKRAVTAGADSFPALDFDAQTRVLAQVETSPFFSIAHMLTLCGVFALPSYGGNRDHLGWKAIGFDSRHHWQPPFGEYDASA